MSFKIWRLTLYWLHVTDITVRHEGVCKNEAEDEETIIYDEDPCQEQKTVSKPHSETKKPLFCASDGKSYYSSKHYACAVRTNGDWFHCE